MKTDYVEALPEHFIHVPVIIAVWVRQTSVDDIVLGEVEYKVTFSG